MDKENEIIVPDRVSQNLSYLDLQNMQYRRFFKNLEGKVYGYGGSTDSVSMEHKEGSVEITEQEYVNLLDNELKEQEDMIQQRKNELALPSLLPIETLSEDRSDLSDAMLDAAVEIQRARECLQAVNGYMRSYEQTNPATIMNIHRQPNGEIVGNVNIGSPKRRLGSLIGDVANHARIALDYIAWGLIPSSIRFPVSEELDSRTKQIYFPICHQAPSTNRKTRESLERRTRTQEGWTSQDAQNLLVSNQPYNGGYASGRHPLEWLETIVNGYKHRTLVFTDKAIHGYALKLPARTVSGGRYTKDQDQIELTMLLDGFDPPPDMQINLHGGVDISIEGITHSVERMFRFNSRVDKGIVSFPIESTMEACLLDIIVWVEETWSRFEQRPDLFTDADSR